MTVSVTISNWDDDLPVVRAMVAASSGTGTGTTPPPVITPPADTNVYPLAMPTLANPGDDVTIGSGPDQIQLRLANNPSSPELAGTFALLADGKAIAAPLNVSKWTGLSASQIFTINGVFASVKELKIAATGPGIQNMWINGVTLRFEPLVYNGPSLDGRGGAPVVNAESVWDNTGATTTWAAPIPVAPPVIIPPPSVPTLSQITATVGGDSVTGSLAGLISAMPASATLALPAGTFVATSTVPNASNIAGAGMGQTVLDCTNLPPTRNKAVLVFTQPGSTISGMTIKGAAIPGSLGGNAAGVRDDAVGDDFTLDSVEITGCQDGILTTGSNVNLTNCDIHDNGAGNPGSGPTHELYFSANPNSTVSLTSCVVKCGTLATHALKSRSGKTSVSNCILTGNGSGDGGANSGRVIDIPNGGAFTMTGGTVILPATAAVTSFFGFGADNQSNPGGAVKFSGVVFDDQTGTGGSIQCFAPPIDIDVTGCTYTGTTAPQLIGWGTVTGEITKA